MRGTLVVLCGLPFAGKSTLARRISAQTGIPCVAIDDVLVECGYSWSRPLSLTDSAWREVLTEVDRRLLVLLVEGGSAIYDSTNHDRASRDRLREFGQSAGVNVTLVLVHVSPEVARERFMENHRLRKRFSVPEPLFTGTLRTYQPPEQDEHPVVFGSGDDPEEWVAHHFADRLGRTTKI